MTKNLSGGRAHSFTELKGGVVKIKGKSVRRYSPILALHCASHSGSIPFRSDLEKIDHHYFLVSTIWIVEGVCYKHTG
jgi:hypothetical protein